MGRILIVLGLLIMIGGAFLPMFGMGNWLAPVIDMAVNTDQRAAELCTEGETLEEETGSSVYTPGQGYGRPVRYFCVNASGERREITGDFAQGMVSEIFGGIAGGFAPILATIGISMVGFLIMVVGILMSIRGRRSTVRVVPVTMGAVPLGGSGFPQQAAGADLAARLRQLEQAYNNNLISREEYDKMRQDILNKSV